MELFKMKIKTIDLNAKEWFDKINGNSYFSVEIIINFGLKNVKILKLPFQYGYGEHYEYESFNEIKKVFEIETEHHHLYQYCKENNIILRTNKQENCLKRDL